MAEHVFDTANIGQWSEPITVPVEAERSIAYAKATDDPIEQHLDATLASPVFAVVPALSVLAETAMARYRTN